MLISTIRPSRIEGLNTDVGIENVHEGVEVALARSGQERIEDDEESKAHGVGLLRGRLGVRVDAAQHRVGNVCLEGFLAPRLPRPQQVQGSP
jgi:hypothetical protein